LLRIKKQSFDHDGRLIFAEEEYKIDIRKTLTRNNRPFYTEEQQTIAVRLYLFGIDRRVYYRRIKENEIRVKAIEVVLMIHQEQSMPRLGGKKSYHILMDDLKSMKMEEINYLIYSELIIY
jgi:hypothetical protein